MTTATLHKRPSRTATLNVSLLEYFGGAAERVDAEAGILYGVKVVGLESRNVGRTIGLDPREFGEACNKPYAYSREALQSAIPMYEGVAVKIDHPLTDIDGSGKRVVRERGRPALSIAGQLKNVQMKEDGLYADVHLLKSHPHSAFILEVAQRMPNKLAMSHHAFGVPTLKNGRAVIDKILEVNSVDIVGDKPGTTNGLFESLAESANVKKTIKKILESTAAAVAGRSILLEMSSEMVAGKKLEEMEVEVPADSAPESHVSDAIRALVMSVFDDESLDTAAKLAKFREIFKVKEKLEGKTTASGEAETTETAHKAADDPTVKRLLEDVAIIKAERDDLKATNEARTLLETLKREPTDVRIEAVKALPTEAKRKALIESWPKRDEQTLGQRPRTSAPLMESGDYKPAKDGEEFAKRLRLR